MRVLSSSPVANPGRMHERHGCPTFDQARAEFERAQGQCFYRSGTEGPTFHQAWRDDRELEPRGKYAMWGKGPSGCRRKYAEQLDGVARGGERFDSHRLEPTLIHVPPYHPPRIAADGILDADRPAKRRGWKRLANRMAPARQTSRVPASAAQRFRKRSPPMFVEPADHQVDRKSRKTARFERGTTQKSNYH